MRLKIQSDGSPHTTHVMTEDGAEISGIIKIEWELDVHHTATARFTIKGVPIDFEGEIPATFSKERTL